MDKFLVLLFAFGTFLVSGQTSQKYASEYANFYRAEELFQKEQFAAARLEFRNFINSSKNINDPLTLKAEYYEAVAALELFSNDAVDLLEGFNKKYPESIYRTTVYFKLAKYYYQKKDFRESLRWFYQLQPSDVEEKQEFYFKKGYAHFQLKEFSEAIGAFYEIKADTASSYCYPALYYYSHIAYTEKAFQTALDGFLILMEKSVSFKGIAPYYIAQIYYNQEKYKEVTTFAPMITDTNALINRTDLDHIIGTSYYKIGSYSEAIPYLERYDQQAVGSRDDDYQLAFAYYKTKNYDKAIKLFDKVAKERDALGQVALYQMGESFAATSNLLGARSSFEAASFLEQDKKLQEDALYNFAVLSYKIGRSPWDEAVLALEKYLKTYPNSKRTNEINQYLVNVYTSTNNYAKALASLDNIQNKDTKLKVAYQLVAFNQGVELYQKNEYDKAIKSFDLVEKYPIDATISGKAKFWKGDSYYRLNQMEYAIKNYRDFIANPAARAADLKNEAYYNIGYAYFKKAESKTTIDFNREIEQGIEAFRIYCQSPNKNKNKLADANMRTADGYYMIKDNENAIKYYNAAWKLKAGFEDQALFYLAKSNGYADHDNEEIKCFSDIVNNYPESKYRLQSIYELGLCYKLRSEYDNAMKMFTKLIEEFPNSTLVVSSSIEIADIYFKQWQYQKSEIAYKKILNEYGEDREICQKAARGLLDVYSLGLKQPDLASNIANDYPCANITVDEQEGLFYNPAIDAYQDSLYANAIPNFEKYIDKFSDGKFRMEAMYYLANCYFKTMQIEKGIVLYKQLADEGTNSYTEPSCNKLSQYFYNKGAYSDAIPYYEKLEKISSKPSVISNAKLGLMRCYFLTENWLNAAGYSKMVLAGSQLTNELKLEAQYALGYSNYQLKSFSEALAPLEWITKNTTTEMAAEAKYTIADMYFQQSEYDKSNTELRALVKMKPSYNYWVAKALMLQTRILMVKNDLVQAEQTLKSVMDHYPDTQDGIMDEANTLWDELMQLKNPQQVAPPQPETVIELNEGGN